jgi:[ribosomal protein S5]-alanine N-acetyltransferase
MNQSSCIISTERLGLRRWVDSDVEPFVRMNQDTEVMRYFPRPNTAVETIAFITRINTFFDEYGYGLFALELKATGEFIGYTGFAKPRFESWFTPCVEIGWRLKRDAWGQGYAMEAAKACLDYGFKELGLDRVYSFTALSNTPSERVMQKIGMERVGEFDHPMIEAGHPLQRHVLYVLD